MMLITRRQLRNLHWRGADYATSTGGVPLEQGMTFRATVTTHSFKGSVLLTDTLCIVLLVKDPFATPDHIRGGGINLLANSNWGG